MTLERLDVKAIKTGKIADAIKNGARKLGVKLSEKDLERLAEFSLAEWWGLPPKHGVNAGPDLRIPLLRRKGRRGQESSEIRCY